MYGGVSPLTKGALVVMKGHKSTTNLYILQGTTITCHVVVTSKSMIDDNATKLWHMRLGHMSENGVIELSRRGLLYG